MKMQDNSAGWPEGWLAAAAAGVFAAVMARVVGDLGLFSTLVVGVFVFLVFGVLLGMFWGGTLSSGGHGSGQGHGHGHGPATGAASGHGPAAVAPVDTPTPHVASGANADLGGMNEGHVGEGAVAEAPVAQGLMSSLDASPAPKDLEPSMVTSEPAIAEPPIATPEPVVVQSASLVSAQPEAAAVDAAGSKPVGLSGPRGGVGDKLQTIEGIGPVLEKLCHELGIFHFDQIAGWGAAEIAWMDSNLKGFKGRVSRDKWVRQASLIGEVGIAEFLRRAKINDY